MHGATRTCLPQDPRAPRGGTTRGELHACRPPESSDLVVSLAPEPASAGHRPSSGPAAAEQPRALLHGRAVDVPTALPARPPVEPGRRLLRREGRLLRGRLRALGCGAGCGARLQGSADGPARGPRRAGRSGRSARPARSPAWRGAEDRSLPPRRVTERGVEVPVAPVRDVAGRGAAARGAAERSAARSAARSVPRGAAVRAVALPAARGVTARVPGAFLAALRAWAVGAGASSPAGGASSATSPGSSSLGATGSPTAAR